MLHLGLRYSRQRLYLSPKLLDLLLYNHSLIYSYKVRYFEVTTSLLPNGLFSTLDSFVVLNFELYHLATNPNEETYHHCCCVLNTPLAAAA